MQNVDGEQGYYRLYVSDGQKDYALRASEDGTSVYAFESSPSSLNSHVWLIPCLEKEFYGLVPCLRLCTHRAAVLTFGRQHLGPSYYQGMENERNNR